MTTSVSTSQHQRIIESLASLIVILLLSLTSSVSCGAVDYCYSDIGCFPLSSEFYHPQHRPFNVRPWHRSRINTHFELFNLHHTEGFILEPWNRLNLLESRFDTKLETKIILPGWLDNLERALWVRRLKDSLLWRWHPVNIIVVHWRNFTPYTIATANTRVVGAELANLLKSIEAQLRYDRSYHHLIGHSLGAHIAGYCGDRLPGLGRITALDPARPFFQHMPKSVRLDRGDAKFVDAIHSDFTPENAILLLMSYGMTTPVGHLDFYPNGPPLFQPGCFRDTILSVRNGIQRGLEHNSLSVAFLESMRYMTACDHQRSHEWFTESINNRECVFVGVRCNEFSGLINGQCTCDDSHSSCAIMGIHADQMYLNNLHTDIWPASRKNAMSPEHPSHMNDQQQVPPVAPSQAPALHQTPAEDLFQQLIRPLTKDDIYGRLKQQADNLRQPPRPMLIEQLYEDLHEIQDEALLEYLRSNFYHRPIPPLPIQQQQQQESNQIPQPNNQAFIDYRSRRQDSNEDEENHHREDEHDLHLTLNSGLLMGNPMNQHPKLLSDIDRDLEDWYEGNSKWFLKTNHRPNYCANQYQVLVYLGPLKSTKEKRRLRANLIISIIGSRGQLMNQRFVPRASSLDSFSMQPFFVILEGSYSLGNILSVAIGWEARVEPDPVQASISFESNLLENAQSFWPTLHVKYPILPETFKHDHSDGFRANPKQPPPPSTIYELLKHDASSAEDSETPPAIHQMVKRSLVDFNDDDDISIDGCSADLDGKTSRVGCSKSVDTLEDLPDYNVVDEVLAGESVISNKYDIDNTLIYNTDMQQEQHFEQFTPSTPISDLALEAQQLREQYNSPQPSQLQLEPQLKTIVNTEFLNPFHTGETKFTAKLHNIDIDIDVDTEDSIVVSQVIVSPLQAHYGKNSIRTARTFCPPQYNYQLRRDQTVRLRANILSRCPMPNTHYSHPQKPITIH